MVRNHTDRNIRFPVCAIRFTRKRANGIEYFTHRVDFKQVVHVLHHACKSFQAHSGVDIRMCKFFIRAVFLTIELRKYKVPNFNVTVAVAADAAARLSTSVFFSSVIMNLRARSARPRPMLPKVIFFAHPDDPFGRHSDFFCPNIKRLIVVLIDCYIEPLCGNLHLFCKKFPCPADCFPFKIIAE